VRIDKWCDSRKLPVRDRLKLFRQVCAAVQSAHDREIIHRDLKPGNILVTAEGTPKLLDFGIAKVLNRELSDAAETTIGAGPMTPEYASPEQVRGERVGPASDIYALGVVLYQLLTGQLPYSVHGGDLRSVARVICEEEPIKPSVAIQRAQEEPGRKGGAGREGPSEARSESPTGLRRQLSGDLDNIVLKALRKEPDRRYTSVAQFSEDLQRFLQDLPVQARKESLPYRGSKFLKRNRVLIMATVFSVANRYRFGLRSGLGWAGRRLLRVIQCGPAGQRSYAEGQGRGAASASPRFWSR
jgi:serine/threonine protein kinase